MTESRDVRPHAAAPREEREKRRAEALRENLRRRKAQARGRKASATTAGEAEREGSDA